MYTDLKHLCNCKVKDSRGEHSDNHAVCCKCVKCMTCNSWIRKDYWYAHPGEPHTLPNLTPVTDEDVATFLEDSMGQALLDMGDCAPTLDAEFRLGFRQCVGQLIDQLANNPNMELGIKERSDAWRYLIKILHSEDDEAKLDALKALFDEMSDELEQQLIELILATDQLLPKSVSI